MRLVRRPLGATEIDGELLALAVLVASGAIGAAWLSLGWPTPACTFHEVTGIPCLTCGGTRSLRDLLAGHGLAALKWNPLVFAAAGGGAVFCVYAAVVTTFRLPRFRLEGITPADARNLRFGIALVAAANWVYLLFRFSGGA